jgi:RimJ/RimL family protein N-acetyltransferase
MIAYDSILYCIRLQDSNISIDYVFLNSPLSQNGLNQWSVDFWLNEKYQGKKIMVSSLMQVFGHMQAMDIEYVYAMVDIENTRSKKLIEEFGFQFINEYKNAARDILLYALRLN